MENLHSYEILKVVREKKRVSLTNRLIVDDFVINYEDINQPTSIHISNSKFNGRIEVNTLSFGLSITFKNCQINQAIDVHNSSVEINIISNSIVEGAVSYYGDGDDSKHIALRVSDSEVHNITLYEAVCKTLFLKNIQSSNEALPVIQFVGNKFIESVNVTGDISAMVMFHRCTFLYPANFNTTPLGVAKFHILEFAFTIFEKLVLFNNCSFTSIKFLNVQFKSGTTFNNAIGIHASNSSLFFAKCNFEKETDLSAMQSGSAKYEWCHFSDPVSFVSCNFQNFMLTQCFFAKSCNFYKVSISVSDRETYRIIKNEFIKINNKIESLIYQKREMEAYEREIGYKDNPADRSILFLSKWSNYYGLNWLWGARFTFCIAFVTFFLYQYSLVNNPVTFGWISSQDFGQAMNIYLKSFFQFWLPTHTIDFMKEYYPSWVSYFIDIIARIFIAYGFVQTVAAFRKFGKVD